MARFSCFTVSLILVMLLGAAVHADEPPLPSATQPIDVLDYFRQSDDLHDDWILGGKDVRADRDPDGTDTSVLVLSKFNSSTSYEVYKVTPNELQLRYEVVRPDPGGSAKNWIRRFQEHGQGHGEFPGAVWMPRHVAPDGKAYSTHQSKDRYVFDPKTHSYDFDKPGSSPDNTIIYSFVWATNDWGDRNHTGMDLNPVLRLISEWQREGKIFEMYDYAHGKGLVNWRWLERVSTLPPIQADATGHLFKCENGCVQVESAGDAEHPPVVFRYDRQKQAKGERLQVISFTSHWAPKLGPQWYVIYRDLSQEGPIEKTQGQLAHDFTLPEWQSKPGATIADLPGVNTTSRKP